MAPSARELLEQAAAQGSDLETVARGVLTRLADLTGLSSTYLAETRLISDEQYIVFSCNRSELFHIPEDVTLPWSEEIGRASCRERVWSAEGGGSEEDERVAWRAGQLGLPL